MGRVNFRGRNRVRTMFSYRNVIPGATKNVTNPVNMLGWTFSIIISKDAVF